MKYLIFIIVAISLVACNKEKIATLEEENSQLKAEYQLLVDESTLKEEFIQDYTSTLNEVYDNLEKIRKREGFLTKASHGIEERDSASLKKRMLSNIASIDNYIKKSKAQLRQLKKKLQNSQMQNKSLDEIIESLNRTVQEKEQYITQLRGEIAQLNTRYAQAETRITEQDSLIKKQEHLMNTGYYIIGSERELKEKSIIEEKGGFLGIRKTKKLAPTFSRENFLSLDIRRTERIPVGEHIRDVKIISPHDPDSYQLLQEEDDHAVLEIVKPDQFWKMKYLVILAKG